MPTKFMRAALLCALMLALTGCIFSRKSLFDISKGATDIPVGRFELRSAADKSSIQTARHGNLYLYGDDKSPEKAILSFHPIGDGFYLTTAILPGGPIHYGVLDARSKDKLPFTLLECTSTTPPDLVPAPDADAFERCNAADRERLTAIANRYKADMMASRIPASKLFEYTRIP
jgi:hypothetical protein